MSTSRFNPSAFLTIQEVDALVDRALAKDPTLPAEALAWVVGYGESQYPSENYAVDKVREYALDRWPEFRSRGKMASGRRTSNILEKLRNAAARGSILTRHWAEQSETLDSGTKVYAVVIGYSDVVAYVHGGNAPGAIAEAEVSWRWMYPGAKFSAYLIGLGGKRECDIRNGRLMFAMNDKVQKLRDQAKLMEQKADRLADLLNVWAVTNPDQVAAVISAG